MNKQKLYSLANKIPKTSDLKVNKIFSQNITINTLFYARKSSMCVSSIKVFKK